MVRRTFDTRSSPLIVVEQFTYLGTVPSSNEHEIAARLDKGTKIYHSIKHIVWVKQIPNRVKIIMYKSF